jgi:hypothetical protein
VGSVFDSSSFSVFHNQNNPFTQSIGFLTNDIICVNIVFSFVHIHNQEKKVTIIHAIQAGTQNFLSIFSI